MKPTHLCLYHITAILSHLHDNTKYVYGGIWFSDQVEEPINRDESTCTADTSTK